MGNRRSIRRPGHDYAQPGAYFVTIRVQGHACPFGEVVAGRLASSEPGQMIERAWWALSARFPTIAIDAFVVMPNHLHGILVLRPRRCAGNPALGRIVGAFKSITTHAYIIGVRDLGWESFPGRLWQRGYHDRVLRDDNERDRAREYIRANPANWGTDLENPRIVHPR